MGIRWAPNFKILPKMIQWKRQEKSAPTHMPENSSWNGLSFNLPPCRWSTTRNISVQQTIYPYKYKWIPTSHVVKQIWFPFQLNHYEIHQGIHLKPWVKQQQSKRAQIWKAILAPQLILNVTCTFTILKGKDSMDAHAPFPSEFSSAPIHCVIN